MFNVLEHDTFFADPRNTLDSDLCRNWTQGAQNGLACTYATPIKAWSGGVLTDNVRAYISNVMGRWILRIGGRDLRDPNLSFIAANASGLSLPDAQHFCVRPLVDIFEMFPSLPTAVECGRIASNILTAYYIQAKVPYFRDGGRGPFGYSGRSRIAGWGLAGLGDAVRLFKASGAGVAQWRVLLGQINHYVTIIKNAYPLVDIPDGPNGDHLNVPHICVFNGGVLARGAISLADALVASGVAPTPPTELYRFAARVCEDMAQAYVPDKGFWYDLPYGTDGKPLPAAEVAAIQSAAGHLPQHDAGSTHVWCASPFTIYVDRQLGTNSAVLTALEWQRMRAVQSGQDPVTRERWVHKQHPVEMVKSFEGWLP